MLIISAKKHLNRIKICDKIIKRVEKVDTLLDGNSVRKNQRFSDCTLSPWVLTPVFLKNSF